MLVALLVFGGSGLSFAQDHANHPQTGQAAPAAAAKEKEHIFCPTMKTGQLCSHGTAAVLGLSDEKNEQWVQIARKYNRAVNAATEQLFKDAEVMLTPQQLELLKAWFAVGLNPEINTLLYGKGLDAPKP
jgi:hypothetical protein